MILDLIKPDSGRVEIFGRPFVPAIGIGAIYVALRAASKILRAAPLMYGKRPTLPELLRWLRAA